jgi:menaquinone-dependent protoporphyrinogen oxidase
MSRRAAAAMLEAQRCVRDFCVPWQSAEVLVSLTPRQVVPAGRRLRRPAAVVFPRARPLLSFLVGSACAWGLWGAISVAADDRYWWPVIPLVGWLALLALYLQLAAPAEAQAAGVAGCVPARACEQDEGNEMTVLVTAASKHGATEEIAERIGADLAARGVHVEVKKLADVDDLGRYSAVVLGSAVYLGTWLRPARAYLDTHAAELVERPTWLFASGSIVGDPPAGDDPNALRPGLAEKLVDATHAREHKLFAGKLDSSKLGVTEKLPVRMARGREGDWRDWQQVDEWAATIADVVTATEASSR